ncbi:MAG TPA: outer membrane beta-barrel protein [Verrucomicrobiota bacterium]|nr:outer membrane beta-barrel protein [Verrucomicrobiota bacterium]
MKLNKWTLGLAAVGAVSLASTMTAKADSNNLSPVQSAIQGLIISGYIDTSIEYGLSPCGNDYEDSPMMAIPFRGYNNYDKQNGFNLNVVQLNFEKPLDEAEYASGGKVSLLYGPDAVGYNPSSNADSDSDFGIKQAYVNLRFPVGNGLEAKIGVFDTIIGYEVFEAGNNPNFTRSWGYWVEPTQHTGVLLAYRFSELVGVQGGIANTTYGGINARKGDDLEDFYCKTFMGSVQLTAPDSMGFLAGSSLYTGVVSGGAAGSGDNTFNYYAGVVANTPIADLTVGAAFDYARWTDSGDKDEHYVIGLYASFKATEKLSFHGRGEYGWWEYDPDGGSSSDGCYYGLTGTVQYDLFANVISRLEIRAEFDDEYSEECGVGLFANIIYTF